MSPRPAINVPDGGAVLSVHRDPTRPWAIEVTHVEAEHRHNGKCRSCGAKRSVLARALWSRAAGRNLRFHSAEDGALYEPASIGDPTIVVIPCACGRSIWAPMVRGKYSAEIACNARCQSATGHNCECQCRGKNHGAAHG